MSERDRHELRKTGETKAGPDQRDEPWCAWTLDQTKIPQKNKLQWNLNDIISFDIHTNTETI